MRCPKCKQEVDLVEMIMDDDLRTVFSVLPRFGQHSRLAFEYAELFGVVPIGRHTKKLTRLLSEVAALFEQGAFTFQKRRYEVSLAGIVEGLKIVCNKHFERPLANHNYLRQVLIGIAELERKQARDAADQALREREARHGYQPLDRGKTAQEEPVVSADEWKQRHGMDSLAAMVGKRL